ncbi:hypothetical protein A6B43_04845 [Vespertiliibacter pulmonis]|uniref:Glycosyl transferase family 9 (Putative heptosyltransferase) n=1 Tax=Vespertiliibacter pulmonis TaxID=1443036 RepID=A0A3N4VQF7_9PAST|nr:glycosyltransferase family 9 protein [Vespertiliibacter pulmonis]QLB20901.1 hypothetical protein A6B43_04845 [Vespertiliibacter pulmonis]RPE83555.1 glycosyl transferase family 9 (putative heptosyltransferase) [Vespertiliibacter pulmonis]
MYKLYFNFIHIGDQICTTAIPENIYHLTGNKCVISDKRIWAFDYNPYVVFMDEEESQHLPELNLIPDTRIREQCQNYANNYNSHIINSQTEFMCFNLLYDTKQKTPFPAIPLKHPRLYIFENEIIKPNRIIVHTTGSDRTRDNQPNIRTTLGEDDVRVMSDDVITSIKKNYQHYDIIQIGGKNDKPLGFGLNLCGQLNYWETAKLIAGSAKFIGVNSGPMHIANCYPRVEKRIVLQEFPASTLIQYKPGDLRNWLFSWLDPSYTYFNKYEDDIGYTYSHTKI